MTKLPADAKVELACACGREQPKPRDHSEVRRIKKLSRSQPEVLAYIEELEALWAYAERKGNVWRGIASAMGYEPKAHDSVKPTTPWLRERIIRYRRAALEQSDAEQGEEQGMGVPASPSGHSQAGPDIEFDHVCQQETDEREDEAELYREAEQDEIRCALALFRSLGRDFGQYRAVKVDGALNWTITKPRTPEALLAALDTEDAAKPVIDRLNRWETFWTNRYRHSPPDGKRIEVRVGDLRKFREAYAVAKPDAHTPQVDEG
jgi:hypothetical protein